jgi:UDP-N-acetylglucosamine 2-epimerase (non-hydrolysing)
MHKARIIVTDSGGVQEGAAALGKRVIVMREVTERPEGVEAGLAELTGTDPSRICDAVARGLAGNESEEELLRLGRKLYGDSQAGRRRIMRIIMHLRGTEYDRWLSFAEEAKSDERGKR